MRMFSAKIQPTRWHADLVILRHSIALSFVLIEKQTAWKTVSVQEDHRTPEDNRFVWTQHLSRPLWARIHAELQLLQCNCWNLKRTDVPTTHSRHTVVKLLPWPIADVRLRYLYPDHQDPKSNNDVGSTTSTINTAEVGWVPVHDRSPLGWSRAFSATVSCRDHRWSQPDAPRRMGAYTPQKQIWEVISSNAAACAVDVLVACVDAIPNCFTMAVNHWMASLTCDFFYFYYFNPHCALHALARAI